jgi:AraC-like DNA-binding protein
MKARYEDLRTKKGNQSFLAYQFSLPRFEFHWHFHPEYELTFITAGKGKRIVGDSYEDFDEHDLVLIGPKVPHTWVSAPTGTARPSACVIQFTREFIDSLTAYPECAAIRTMLTRAEKGLRFPMAQGDSIVSHLTTLSQNKGPSRITGLLAVLENLSERRSLALASESYKPSYDPENEKRINQICHYIERETTTASIRKASALIHLSESAFCKFFKRQTGKTFSDYVNTIRIGDACRMLTETDRTIADIAHATGFESITYFNRVFLRKKGVRPGDFRKNTQ